MLITILGLSALFHAMLSLFQWTVLNAVGADSGLLEVAIAAGLIILVNLLSILINGLSVTGGVFVVLYSRFGVPAEITLCTAILRRVVIIAAASIGLIHWHRLGVRDPEPR